MTSSIDVLIVLHNSKRQLPALFNGLRNISIPVGIHFLDNNSTDETPQFLLKHLYGLPFPAYFNRSLRNNGFARGMNLLAGKTTGEFMFMLNPDTEIEPGCLEKLVHTTTSDERIGICEARQWPREHPKRTDPQTGETTWCSGAAALVRRSAFDDVGGFDERLFFMYCEDVDLSWKLWLKGWRCVYVRDAVVRHFTQDLTSGKRRTRENYYSFRNSLFLFYRFGSVERMQVLRKFLSSRFLSRAYSLQSKILFGIAFIDHIRYIPYLLQTRDIWSSRQHPWVRFEETSLSR